jgi:tetratricopeptide (TPR) repeat protein
VKARKAPRAYLDTKKALELRSDAPELLELRGRVLQALNARAGAIEAYRKALAGDPRLTRSRIALWRLRAGT